MEAIESLYIQAMDNVYEETALNKSPSTTVNTEQEANQLAQDLLKSTKITLFYVQYSRIYPAFMPQPPCPVQGKVVIHFIRHAEVGGVDVESLPSPIFKQTPNSY